MKKIKAKFRSTETPSVALEARIQEIFGKIRNYSENRVDNKISFDIDVTNRYGDVTFEHLAKLSDLLGTRKINMSNTYEVNSGCETCGYGSLSVQPVSCSEVKFPEEEVAG